MDNPGAGQQAAPRIKDRAWRRQYHPC